MSHATTRHRSSGLASSADAIPASGPSPVSRSITSVRPRKASSAVSRALTRTGDATVSRSSTVARTRGIPPGPSGRRAFERPPRRSPRPPARTTAATPFRRSDATILADHRLDLVGEPPEARDRDAEREELVVLLEERVVSAVEDHGRDEDREEGRHDLDEAHLPLDRLLPAVEHDPCRRRPERVERDARHEADDVDVRARDAVVEVGGVGDPLRDAEPDPRGEPPEARPAPVERRLVAEVPEEGEELRQLLAEADSRREAEEARHESVLRVQRGAVGEADELEDDGDDRGVAAAPDPDPRARRGLHEQEEHDPDRRRE